MKTNRREFFKKSGLGALAAGAGGSLVGLAGKPGGAAAVRGINRVGNKLPTLRDWMPDQVGHDKSN